MLTVRMAGVGLGRLIACLPLVLLGLAFAALPATASGTVLLPSCSNVLYGGQQAPTDWSSGCLGGSANLGQLSWQGWETPAATATGVIHYNDCEPSCAEGTIFDYPAELRVEQIKRCASPLGPQAYYTVFTLTIDFPPENAADQPAGRSTPVTFSSACPTPGYLVKTRSKGATFGAFEESGEYDGDRLDSYFGPPSKRKRDGYLCTKHWRAIGLTVWVGSLDADDNPCYSGRFLRAILKGRRWHTPTGVRNGSPARKAASASIKSCTISLCRANGYVLAQHFSVCANGRFPSIVADTGGGRVERLLIFSHSCE